MTGEPRGRLRVLCIAGSLVHGGAERHAITLLNGFAARGHEGHLAWVKNESTQLDRLQRDGRTFAHCLGATHYLERRALADLARLMDRVSPDVIVAQNPYALLHASLARRLAREPAPIVTVFHSNRLLGLKEQLQMAAYRPLFWTAACTVFVCEAQRRHWRRQGVFSRRNEVIHNGVDTAAFRPAPDAAARGDARHALGFGGRDYVVGIVAALRPEKDHVLLVDALAGLLERGIPARALLIGDGETRAGVEARARRLGVAARVTITGFQPDVRPFVLASDTMTLCSRTEALPLAAIEAMALGKPVVIPDVGGCGEIVTPGWNGFLFRPGDRKDYVARLAELADPATRARLGARARATVEERFSEGAMIERYEQLLSEVAAGRRGAATRRAAARPAVLVLGPAPDAVSGVSFHLRTLLASPLSTSFELRHFQIGGEGRSENVAARMLRLAASPFALGAAIRREAARVVHVNTSLNAGAFWRDFAYMLVARAAGARVVCQVHGGALPHLFLGRWRPLRSLLRFALGRADVIVVLARTELDAYRRFLPGANIVHLPNAVAIPPRVARAPRAATAPFSVLYLGRLIRSKGLLDLVRAVALLNRDGETARLVVAGTGPHEAEARELAIGLGLAGTIEFTGAVAGEAKARLFAEADVFVLATSHPEGLPYALIEAMAAGLPVVTTPIGAIPDLVTDGVQGLFVPAGDPEALARALRALAADRARLSRMGAAAHARVRETCSIERLVGRFGEIYGELGGTGAAWPSLAG